MAHFRVERHSPTEWRIVNRHIGHGLLFPTKKLATQSAVAMNRTFKDWITAGMKTNPFPKRKGQSRI